MVYKDYIVEQYLRLKCEKKTLHNECRQLTGLLRKIKMRSFLTILYINNSGANSIQIII